MSFRLVSDEMHDSVKALSYFQLPIENDVTSTKRAPIEGSMLYDVATKSIHFGDGVGWNKLSPCIDCPTGSTGGSAPGPR